MAPFLFMEKRRFTSKTHKEYEIIELNGVSPTFTFSKNGEKQSILGFHYVEEVEEYIKKREKGQRHFMDID